MSIDILEGNWPLPGWPEYKRFFVKIPIIGLNGNIEGMVQIHVMAENARQARAHARKEMIKIARRSTNKAQVREE